MLPHAFQLSQSLKRPSEARVIRAVASSTAIETGQPIHVLETQIKEGQSKFKQLTLAS